MLKDISDPEHSSSEIILEVKDLKKYFPLRRGFLSYTVEFVLGVEGV